MGFKLVTRVGMHTRDPRVLAELAQGFLRGVVASNRITIRNAKRRGKPIPLLYASGVVWEPEPWAGRFEEFADIVTVLRRGWGDCDDLCAWRCAELQEAGEPADVRLYWRPPKPNKGHMFHVEVRRATTCPACGLMQGHPDIPHPVCSRCSKPIPRGHIEDVSRFIGL